MIAACDTFRSGAVEQLKTHCNRLNIPLYERGYEKDPAKVAYEATMQAARSKIDVLLVDTAGGSQLQMLETQGQTFKLDPSVLIFDRVCLECTSSSMLQGK